MKDQFSTPLGAKLRVLMQNRPNAVTQPGGDTVVMNRTADGLRERGIEVVIDLNGSVNPAEFDLVHLFNFALPDFIQRLAHNAARCGTPFVITTLCEDVPSFHNQSHAVSNFLQEYVRRGQDKGFYASGMPDSRSVQACQRFSNDWVANNAAALLANGKAEALVLQRDYPGAANIHEVKLGFDFSANVDRNVFLREFGIQDFILCVGRIESRKNQLMLLKALEDSDLPVVLAGGGVTYQPDYEAAVRSFKRKGRTLVLPRISAEMLASAYACAKVHVLPSWYELPGLVTLEAAAHGCAVVATDRGTTRDYMGNFAYYCEPDNACSIFNAVMAAFYSPAMTGAKQHVMSYTWGSTVERTIEAYKSAVPQKQPSSGAARGGISLSFNMPGTGFEETVASAEKCALDGNFERALQLLDEAEKQSAGSARVRRARAAIFLAQNNESEARTCFQALVSVDPSDSKAWTGLGMCHLLKSEYSAAMPLFIKALQIEPTALTAIHQLIQCSYQLGTYSELEAALRNFLQIKPNEIEMQFCLAGCLYQQNRHAEARTINDAIIAVQPSHKGANELAQMLKQPEAPQTQTIQFSSIATSPATSSLPVSSQESFDDADRQLMEIEDFKRQHDFKQVEQGLAKIKSLSGLTALQNEQISLIEAEAWAMQGDLARAQGVFDRVLQNNPNCARAHAGCGALAAHRAELKQAEGHFKRALECKPNYDVALAGLGICASLQGFREVAWQYYQQASRVNPENLRAVLGLIEVGYGLNKLPEVEGALRAYLDLHPADLNILYSLAGCCYAQKKLNEATSAIEKIMLFEPNHEKARELRTMIEKTSSTSL